MIYLFLILFPLKDNLDFNKYFEEILIKKEKKEEKKNISNVSTTLPIKSKKGNMEEKNKVSSYDF